MSVAQSFTGGMNAPLRGSFGRVSVSTPMAELIIDDAWLTLRPRLLGAALTGPFRVRVSDIRAAYPVTGFIGGEGVGLSTSDDQTAFFWSTARDEILQVLTYRGVPVERTPRPASQIWRLRSPEATVTQQAALQPWVRWLMLFGLAAATVMTIRGLGRPAPLLWHAMSVISCLVGLPLTVLLWNAGRRPHR